MKVWLALKYHGVTEVVSMGIVPPWPEARKLGGYGGKSTLQPLPIYGSSLTQTTAEQWHIFDRPRFLRIVVVGLVAWDAAEQESYCWVSECGFSCGLKRAGDVYEVGWREAASILRDGAGGGRSPADAASHAAAKCRPWPPTGQATSAGGHKSGHH